MTAPPQLVQARRPTRLERWHFRVFKTWPDTYVEARIAASDENWRRTWEWMLEQRRDALYGECHGR